MRLLLSLLSLAAGLSFVDGPSVQCGPKPAVEIGQCPLLPSYEWSKDEADSTTYRMTLGGQSVAAFWARSGRLWVYDNRAAEWKELPRANAESQGSALKPISNGMIRHFIQGSGERWEVNGKDVSPAAGRGRLAMEEVIPDDSALPTITFIGDDAATEKGRALLASAAEGLGLDRRLIVKTFRPDNALIRKAGFKTGGSPTIYGQLAGGEVVWRVDELPTAPQLAGLARRLVAAAEGKRVPDPAYDPAADPGLVLKPQVDATVQPASWILALTHLAALLAGGMGALGGRWALVSMLVEPAIAAVEARLQARVAASAAPQPPAAPSVVK
jgi:hypothetical protein